MRADADAAATTPMRVLLVDDDDDLLRALQRALRRALPGLVVDAMNDPRRALAAMPHADLAVVDMAMPEINGVELIMNVAAFPRSERPVLVAMSSVASGGDRALVRSLGASYFLPKDDRLVSTLCAIVGERRRAQVRGLS